MFEAHLKANQKTLRPYLVRVYVMGANEWRNLLAWPPRTEQVVLALHAEGHMLEEPPAADSIPDRYTYDPRNPTPSAGGPLPDPKAAGQQDNAALELRPDVLCHTTPELKNDVEIVGSPRVTLSVCSTADSTDFFGRVCDVHPDGRSMNVCDGMIRIELGRVNRGNDGILSIEIELSPTGYRFLKGHRIRLQVSSGAHPRWSRNLGKGEPLGTATQMATAEQIVYHDLKHPSALSLPTLQ